jgi:phenylacetate-coenzyme A ligase PaaK-like adenylate-forming protein
MNPMHKLGKKINHFFSRYRPLEDFFGDEFKQVYAFLLESSKWNREKIREYKLERLKSLLKHAALNVPYYRDLFKSNNIDYRDIKSFEDYAKLPILTKVHVQENFDKLKADNFNDYNPVKSETSGTTGNVAVVYRSSLQEAYRKAVLWRKFQEYDYNFRDPRVTVTSPRVFANDSYLCEHDRIENNLIINTFHVINRNVDKIIEKIKSFKPKMIWAHPNIFCVLADHIISNGLDPIEIPLIITHSERTAPDIRKKLERAFPTTFLEHYGNRENTISCWGSGDATFHELSEYCHLEVESDNSIADHPNAGDLISTSLNNYAFPLIRYEAGDIVELLGYDDPGIPYPRLRLIGGRGKDMLLTREGLTVPYVTYYLEKKGLKFIKQAQIEQVSLDEIIFRIVPIESYNREIDESKIIEMAEQALANKFTVNIEYMDQIPFTKTGKLAPIISKLAVDYLKQ